MDAAGMDRLLAATAGRIKRGWAGFVAHLRDENPVERIAARLHAPGAPLVGLDAAVASYAAAQLGALVAAGQDEARWAAEQVAKHQTSRRPDALVKKLLYFDAGDPGVLTWAERNKLDLVKDLTFESRVVVRAALIEAEDSGENPLVTATRIRDAIGLTEQQLAWVDSYRAALGRGEYTAALERELSSGLSDRVIAAAVRRGASLTPAQIDAAVERYRDNALTVRALAIARTESSRIAHQGSDELYRQSLARGDLQADQLEGEWLHSPKAKGEHERAFHVVMHGQRRPWGVPFVSGLGNELRFPGDPDAPPEETVSCRCTRTVRIRAAGAKAA